MKVKYNLITIIAALAIILAGYFGTSAVFNAYFNAGIDLYEETDNSGTVKSAARETIFRCSYPLTGGWQEPQEKDEYFDEKVNTLCKVATLVGLNTFSDTAFKEYESDDNDINYVIDSTVNNDKDRMSAAFRYNIFYGFYIRPTALPSEDQIKTAVEDLKIIVENDQLLQEFFKSIQGFMDDIQGDISPQGYIVDDSVSETMRSMMSQCEDPAVMTSSYDVYKTKYSLYNCYQYGEKHIFTDGKDTVLVSSVGGYGIAVFYDAINRKFCGINLINL